jgi:hypothetical protein
MNNDDGVGDALREVLVLDMGTCRCVIHPLTLVVPLPLYKSIGAINVFVQYCGPHYFIIINPH